MPPKGGNHYSKWFEDNGSQAYHPTHSNEDEPSYNCGYGEYFNVDREKCEPMTHPMDQFVDETDLVEVEFPSDKAIVEMTDEEFADWEYNREDADYDDDPGQSEYEMVMDEMLQFEMQTQGKNMRDFVWWGINRDDDDWDAEIELLTVIITNGYNYYTYDPRPE